MSPRVADPAHRAKLIESAARLIAERGSKDVSIRQIAREAGTSTMAIYTHFGGIDELRAAVRSEGFGRLQAAMKRVRRTRDTVADLILMGAAYTHTALQEPNLYQAMFFEGPVADSDKAEGDEAFAQLREAVERCMANGRFGSTEPALPATELWAFQHGLIALHLAGLLQRSEMLATLNQGGLRLLRAFGDDPRAIGRSASTARRRLRSEVLDRVAG